MAGIIHRLGVFFAVLIVVVATPFVAWNGYLVVNDALMSRPLSHDYPRIERNLKRLKAQGAPQKDIQTYLDHEGVTTDEVLRNTKKDVDWAEMLLNPGNSSQPAHEERRAEVRSNRENLFFSLALYLIALAVWLFFRGLAWVIDPTKYGFRRAS